MSKFKIVIITDKKTEKIENVFLRIYEIYVDIILKNPFIDTEQPIKCDSFNNYVEKVIIDMDKSYKK